MPLFNETRLQIAALFQSFIALQIYFAVLEPFGPESLLPTPVPDPPPFVLPFSEPPGLGVPLLLRPGSLVPAVPGALPVPVVPLPPLVLPLAPMPPVPLFVPLPIVVPVPPPVPMPVPVFDPDAGKPPPRMVVPSVGEPVLVLVSSTGLFVVWRWSLSAQPVNARQPASKLKVKKTRMS